MADIPETGAGSITYMVRSLFNEPTASSISDAEILVWIDQAAADIATKTNLLETSSILFTLATGTTEYAIGESQTIDIADDFKIFSALYLGAANETPAAGHANAKALLKIHPRMITNVATATAGPPRFWYTTDSIISTEKTVIGVRPEPTSSENGHVVKLFYYQNINDYFLAASTSTYYLPEWLQPYVAWYAYAKCLERDRKPMQARQYMSIFENFIAFHRNDVSIEPVDSKDMMMVPDYTKIAQ